MVEWLEELKKNPFWVLDASPWDTREDLIRKQGDMALFGDDALSRKALTALLHPQTRLEAEMHWFPQTEPERIRRFIRFLEGYEKGQHLSYLPTDSVLARFNAIRIQMNLFSVDHTDQLAAIFHSLAVLADGLFPKQIRDELNADRRRSKFLQLEQIAEVSSQIRQLLQMAVNDLLDRFPVEENKGEIKELSDRFQTEYKSRDSRYHNNYLMELVSEEMLFRIGKA